MSLVKSVGSLLVGGILIGTGYYMGLGCPNKAAEAQFGVVNCARLGWIRSGVPLDGASIATAGEEALRSWGTSSKQLEQNYKSIFPQPVFKLPEGRGCLSAGKTREAYNQMKDQIPSLAKQVKSKNCLDDAYARSTLRSQARSLTRANLCDLTEIEIENVRDQAVYGAAKPTFAHLVGKYVKIAAKKCIKGACDIKEVTCKLLMKGAETTNQYYNFFAKFFY